jgi:glutathione S-transferase
MLLHDLPAGLHPRRVRIFIAEKGLQIPVRVVDAVQGENTQPDFLRLNPLGQLPVLQLDDGSAIAESMAICRYLEALHPEPALFGRGALEAAQVEMWTRRMETRVSDPIVDIFLHSSDFYRGRVEQLPAVADWSRARVLETLAWLDGELARRPYVAGERYTVADIVAQCAFVLGKAVGLRIPPERAHLARWFAAVSARPTARA